MCVYILEVHHFVCRLHVFGSSFSVLCNCSGKCCRFYFVGDEDLLEIIGNSKNVAKLQKHFKKMFAGVSSIILNEDSTVVLGISSREGEEVRALEEDEKPSMRPPLTCTA